MDAPHKLVTWYRANKRDLPWRNTRDPYAIWVSEMMLQQTRVETVIPYFHAFMTAFSTVESLAAADEEQVLKLWQGLGYYARVRNLHKAAKEVVMRYNGIIPDSKEAFLALPGVGHYTCGAVLSIAHEQPVPAVDGNVMRVVTRFLGIREAIETSSAKQSVHRHVEQWLAVTQPSDLTQSLMELGAVVCLPRSPKCEICPLGESCRANRDRLTAEIPARKPKPSRKIVDVLALWLEDDEGVVMQQRPASGLLANMWQLPSIEVSRDELELDDMRRDERLLEQLQEFVAIEQPSLIREQKLQAFVSVATERHIFTHLEWFVTVYRPVGHNGNLKLPGGTYLKRERANISLLPLPRVYEKLIQAIQNQGMFTEKG